MTVRQPPPDDLDQVERACDATFLHLLGEDLISPVVVSTLRQIMREAHELHEDASPSRRWWAS
jgi:hypothetical protein